MNFSPLPDDISAAWDAVLDYRLSDEAGELPAEHRDALTAFLKLDAPPLTISQTAEYVFAHRDEIAKIAPELSLLGAQCALYGDRKCIDNLGGGRGQEICIALRRDAGEAAHPLFPWPTKDDDPVARTEFIQAPAEVAEAALAEELPAALPAKTPAL